jgi:hypothetical protein
MLNEGDSLKRGDWQAVAELHRAFATGLILTVVTQRGTEDAAEMVFRLFRRQQQERFLPGLERLGLSGLAPAVASAQYHYLSNWIGGVNVEYMRESDRKAWIRYPPPRWIWGGTALCGIPSDITRAMLLGWHANNGVMLGTPRLGFVCTKMATDARDGLEGYYLEHDRDLEPGERLAFADDEDAPPFDPASAPVLPAGAWPAERLAKAHRNYAMEYVRTVLPVAVALFGTDNGAFLLRRTGRMVGMQYGDMVIGALAETAGDPGHQTPEELLSALFSAQGDTCRVEANGIVQSHWRLMDGVEDFHPACRAALHGLVEGIFFVYGRGYTVQVEPTGNAVHGTRWRIVETGIRNRENRS